MFNFKKYKRIFNWSNFEHKFITKYSFINSKDFKPLWKNKSKKIKFYNKKIS